MAASGGEGGDSVRAAELRGHIAELMKDAAGSTSDGGSARAPTSDLPPPAYE
jgi:hypothetical protein